MERHFDEELKELKKNIMTMHSLVDRSISAAIKVLKKPDPEAARNVIEDDERIDMMELKIDRQCMELIAKRQPMAVDLRVVTSIMKINSDLERIADLSISVARRAESLSKLKQIEPIKDVPEMAERAGVMLRDAMRSMVENDAQLARKICNMDEDIDGLYVKNFRETLTYMLEDNTNIKAGIHLILACKQIERMADHVTNIAEDVVYMIEGKTIKHHMEEKGGGDNNE